ncbi:MAG: hypothetical protein NZT61_01605 [Deltaproteobacteria bacterium]|nr:hypothetical protein [Deltaproteobacteria bacterium]
MASARIIVKIAMWYKYSQTLLLKGETKGRKKPIRALPFIKHLKRFLLLMSEEDKSKRKFKAAHEALTFLVNLNNSNIELLHNLKQAMIKTGDALNRKISTNQLQSSAGLSSHEGIQRTKEDLFEQKFCHLFLIRHLDRENFFRKIKNNFNVDISQKDYHLYTGYQNVLKLKKSLEDIDKTIKDLFDTFITPSVSVY